METKTHNQNKKFSSTLDSLHQVLTVIHNLQTNDPKFWVSSLEVSHILRDDQGIRLHWKTIDGLLAKNKSLVERRKRQKRWEYYLLAAGRELVTPSEKQITVVQPNQALQTTLHLQDLLANFDGTIRICDPYLDPSTIEHLDAMRSSVDISFLTKTVRDSGKLRRLLAAARHNFNQFEIRIVETNTLHDRYIIDESKMIILGTSLNGFGKKQCFIVRAGNDVRYEMLKAFERLWLTAKVWP